jgi:hypothetical protein
MVSAKVPSRSKIAAEIAVEVVAADVGAGTDRIWQTVVMGVKLGATPRV